MNVKKITMANLVAMVMIAVSLVCAPKAIHADTYQTGYTIVDSQTNQVSSIDPFFDKPAQVTALGSRYKVTFNIELVGPLSNSQVTSLIIDGSPVAVNVLSNDADDKVSQVTFYTADLQRALSGSISLAGQTSGYQFQFQFGSNNIPNSNANNNASQASSSSSSANTSSKSSSSAAMSNKVIKKVESSSSVVSSSSSSSSGSSSSASSTSSSSSSSSSSAKNDSEASASDSSKSHKKHQATTKASSEQTTKKGNLLNPAVLITIGAVVLIGAFAYWRSVSHK